MPRLQILNDTVKVLILRVNLLNTMPSAMVLKPHTVRSIKVQSEDVLIKLWDNSVLLVQEIEKEN